MVDPEIRMVGRYALFRPLADGGMATVHLGCLRTDGGFSRPVAVKVAHPHLARDTELVARLLSEARIASRIRHPNVVPVLDVIADAAQPCLVFEYVHGESLAQLLAAAAQAGEEVPLGVALRIVVDVLEGLHAAHEATNENGVPLLVVHRDVSPQNVMVDADGRARLVDFGVAKALERPFSTESGVFRGKLAYAAPEQMTGLPVDRRTDVWAVGIVLWELLACRRLFAGAEPAAIVHRVTTEDVPPPSLTRPCPAAIDAVVARATARDPDARFASARAMALAIEKAESLADARDVARWVRRLARAKLEERSVLVAEMESALREAATAAPVVAAVLPPSSPGARRGTGIVVAVVASVVVALASALAVSAARKPASVVAAPPPSVSALVGSSAAQAAPPPVPAASPAETAAASSPPPSAPPPPVRAAAPARRPPRAAGSAKSVDPLGMDRRL